MNTKKTLIAGLVAVLSTLAAPLPTHAASQPSAHAQYTLLCQTYSGLGHAQLARQAKDALIKSTKLKDWYVVTSDTESNLYFGFYHSFDDPKDPDTARAQADHKTLAAMVDTNGNRPFQYAVFIPVPGADPPAPPEWDLRNAKGYFTLDIASYMDSPLRKQYAVDAVRKAREMGIPAYFYHGDTASEVCIGAWPRDAVREQEASEGRTTDPNQPVLVSTIPLPASMKNLRTKDTGEKVKVLSPHPEYLDPTLKEYMAKYPTHSINGELVVRKYTDNGQDVSHPDPSFLALIPTKEEVVKQDPVLEQKAVDLGVAPTPLSAPKPGEGRLKSISQ